MLLMKYSLEAKEACVLSKKQNRDFHSESTGIEDMAVSLSILLVQLLVLYLVRHLLVASNENLL